METSAQILRVAGSPMLQSGINDLVYSSGQVGTSAAVEREFENVYIRFMDSVASATRMLAGPSRSQLFEELWPEVEDLLPMFYPGGHKLLQRLTAWMFLKFGGQLVTPTFLLGVLEGHKEDLRAGFLGPVVADKSSCGVWATRGSCDCAPEPGEHCRLKEICVTKRRQFVISARRLADARPRRDESKWLDANFDRLDKARGMALLEILGKHPGPVGDIVIFWEVPDGWTILTRDKTFRILQEALRARLKVYIVRLPRENSGGRCRIRPEAAAGWEEADLLNYTPRGARIRAPTVTLQVDESVILASPKFSEERRGNVIYVDKADRSVVGIKFPYRQP
ncbi:MAG TPA: hypothetical protein VF659_14570 [Pyrinomonadaceae bacterium]|jgi:hypothetical protein